MRIITGDECGLLKETIPELCRPKHQDKHSPSTQDGVRRVDPTEFQSRSRGVVDMSFTSPPSSFAALRVNGSIELWQEKHATNQAFGTYHRIRTSDNIFASNQDDETDTQTRTRPIALDSLQDKNRLCAADSLGRLVILKADSASIEANYSPFAKQASTISYTKGQYLNMDICSAMAVDSVGSRIAVAGRERETTLVDLETGDTVWKAKNLSPDPQTLLQHPIWSTALLFLDSSVSFCGSNHIMAAGTAYKQVRLYDVRTDSKVRRPISYTPEGFLSHRVTALCQVDSNHLVVGDSAGFLHSLDTRMFGRKRKGNINLARFVGPVGSIRQVVKHDSQPILATVGLDRMLRTYNVENRKQLDCVYLKQRLNCLLIFGDETWSSAEMDVTVDMEDDDIDVEDEVHDYVDSEGESASEDSAESTDDNVTSESDKDESEDESGEDSDEEDEPELPQTASPKRRRI